MIFLIIMQYHPLIQTNMRKKDPGINLVLIIIIMSVYYDIFCNFIIVFQKFLFLILLIIVV